MIILADFLASIAASAARLLTLVAAYNMALASYDGHMTFKIAYAVITFVYAAYPSYATYSKQEMVARYASRKHTKRTDDDRDDESAVNVANHLAVLITCVVNVAVLYILNYFGA